MQQRKRTALFDAFDRKFLELDVGGALPENVGELTGLWRGPDRVDDRKRKFTFSQVVGKRLLSSIPARTKEPCERTTRLRGAD